ncbi:MAG TPA: hypothetical protein VEX86_13210, partial [Longimicrobium sp.]|nr:hypothetical protein [Longimicrobium sp.]
MTRSPVRLLPLLALAAIPAAAHAQAPADPWAALGLPRTRAPRPTTAAITPGDMMTRVYALADDSMKGRLLARPENAKAAEYIAAELRRMGLEPAGDNGTFFQAIPLVDRVVDDAAPFSVNGTALRAWTDYVPRDNGPGARSVDGVQVIYAGTMSDSTQMVDSLAVTGKLVVVGMGPTFVGNPPGTANRAAMVRRYRRAAGIAFAGLDRIPESSLAQYREPLQVMAGQRGPDLPSYLYVTARAAALLLGADPAGLRPGATGPTVAGSPRFVERPTAVPARNVVALLRGSDPVLGREFVAIGAHNDHIGTTPVPVAHDSMYIVNHLFRTSGADDPEPRLTPEQQRQVNDLLAR